MKRNETNNHSNRREANEQLKFLKEHGNTERTSIRNW